MTDRRLPFMQMISDWIKLPLFDDLLCTLPPSFITAVVVFFAQQWPQLSFLHASLEINNSIESFV